MLNKFVRHILFFITVNTVVFIIFGGSGHGSLADVLYDNPFPLGIFIPLYDFLFYLVEQRNVNPIIGMLISIFSWSLILSILSISLSTLILKRIQKKG